ncbi:MAG: OmpH family outer membrane protein [Firmicutes bacterium]|nr:OmpH family outer membrane protein [Bacillota bacterium]
MIKDMLTKNRSSVLAGIGVLLVLIVLGTSVSMTRAGQNAAVGYVHSEKLVDSFIKPAIEQPLSVEIERLQGELDAEVAPLLENNEEENLEEAQAIKNKYEAILDQRKQELIAPLLAELRASIEKIADSRGISIVLDNTYGMVIYGGVDLTDAVLSDLLAGE